MKAGGGWLPGRPLGAGGEGAPDGREAAGDGPAEEDTARFAGLMRAAAPLGAAVLAGMGGAPPPAASPAAKMVEELAERLLVSDDAGGGGGGGDSVRALAAPDVGVPGLEVVVRREPGGGLAVELLAEHPADLALLRGGAAELAGRLEARFGARAEVRVGRRGGPAGQERPRDGGAG